MTWASSTQAQDAGSGTDDALASVRTRVAFGASEDRLMDRWIDDALGRLKADAGPDGDGVQASRDFRVAVGAELRNAQATSQFLQRFVDRFSTKAAAELRAGDDDTVARGIVTVLKQIGRVATRDALNAGLQYRHESVRHICATSYAALLDDLSADVNTAQRTIGILKDAGTAETSGVVLEAIYDALSYERARFVGDTSAALAEIFAARAQRRAAGQDLRTDRAELTAYQYLQKVRSNIPRQAVPPLIRSLAALFALDVRRYESAQAEELRDIQERIYECEQILNAYVNSGGGDVRGKMALGGDVVIEEMGLELLKWVGGQGQKGALNQDPWNVPVGGLP